MAQVYLSLGSNVGDRYENLQEAIESLKAHEEISSVKSSPIYETVPVGFLDQANFLNIVLELETVLEPEALLIFCQSIEAKLGRKRTIKNGPRTIDLDILLYEEKVINTDILQVPHPRMHERAFVLVPFLKLNAEAILPTTGETMAALVEKLAKSDIDDVKEWDSQAQYGTISDRLINVEK